MWAAAAGLAKQKSVRLIWPELADALDGLSRSPLDVVAEPDAPDPAPPLCGYCRTERAIGRMTDDDTPCCVHCRASHGRHARPAVMNPAWRQWRRDQHAARMTGDDGGDKWADHEKRRGRT
jgi:hypothetical protein